MQEVVLEGQVPPKKSRLFGRLKRRLLKHVWLVRVGIIAALAAGIYLLIVGVGFIFAKSGFSNNLSILSNFIFAPSTQVNISSGRTNFLILGKGGQGHDAPDLTDTIIFASISHDPAGVTLVSLPRDIWIPEIRAKVNSAYYWGNQIKQDGGLVLAKSTVEEIVGVPVHYAVVVDFSGFGEILDVLGGVEVDVREGFVDEKYPIPGKENDLCNGDKTLSCRYETIKFEKGNQLMDGATALKFVRSRNSEGDEGTDLARAARQQLLLMGIKKKVLDPKFLLSPKKLWAVWRVVNWAVKSDISSKAAAVIARKIADAKGNITGNVIPEEFLINPPVTARYDNQYVFIPRVEDWSEVRAWIKQILP